MQQNKTKPTPQHVEDYIANIKNVKMRSDAKILLALMQQLTGEHPVMWGPSIVGFGSYHYVYESGREGDSLRVGFSARTNALVIYGILPNDENHINNNLVKQLGKHKQGKSCMYVKTLADVNIEVLTKMIQAAFATY